jgi:hypothetical protein
MPFSARSSRQSCAAAELRQELDAMVPLVKQVMKQTRARIFRGDTHAEDKILRAPLIFRTIQVRPKDLRVYGRYSLRVPAKAGRLRPLQDAVRALR